jgi:hypothetical protein
MPDSPVALKLPKPREGLSILTATFTNAQIVGSSQTPAFGTATTGEFLLPVGSFLLCDFSAGAIPTGPTTNIRNTPAPLHGFTTGAALPFTAEDRMLKLPQAVLNLAPSSELSAHRLEVGFGAAPAGGNAANRMLVIIAGIQIAL